MFEKNMKRGCVTNSRQDAKPHLIVILFAWSNTAQRARYNRKLVRNTVMNSEETLYGKEFLLVCGFGGVVPFYPSLKTRISEMSPSLLQT